MPEDIPGLPELARSFADFRQEYRADRNLFVRADLYQTERSHILTQLTAVKSDQEALLKTVKAEQDASRKETMEKWTSLTASIRTGLIGSVFAVAVALVVAWFK